MEYTSIGKGNAALTTGIIGTAGVGLGLLGNLLGMNGNCAGNAYGAYNYAPYGCSDNMLVNRYEAAQSAMISELRNEVKLRDAEIYSDKKDLEMYRVLDGKIEGINAFIAQQNALNTQVAANLSCMQANIASLQGLTRLVVPKESICPEMMLRFNSWQAPTAVAPDAQVTT